MKKKINDPWKNYKTSKSWGTDETSYPFVFPLAKLSKEELKRYSYLTPSERLEWLLMMQELLWEHHRAKKTLMFSRG